MGVWALVPAGWSSARQGPIDQSRPGKTQTDQGLTGQGLTGQSLTGQNLADQGPTGHTEQVNSWALGSHPHHVQAQDACVYVDEEVCNTVKQEVCEDGPEW